MKRDAAHIEIPAPSTATTFTDADKAVRETAHLLANTHLPYDRRYELAHVHQANLDRREALRGMTS